ncbi:MAG: acylphosphatase, partial [Euryarchaeota archaeon CG_4_9_14_3_um_filter_38_12]
MINKRIIIEGEKVHNVGYRPFLLSKAWELNIPNYFARNIKEEDGVEQVEVYLGGDEEQVQEFIEFIKNNYPPKANVSGVREAEPPGRIMQIDKYDRVLSAEQRNTMVQTGLIMIGKQDQMIGKQ